MKTIAVAAGLSLVCLACTGTQSRPTDPQAPGTASAPESGVAELTEQVAEAALPEPVLAAVRSHPRAILVKAVKVTRAASVQYDLTLTGTQKTRMIVTPDGRVLSFK
jgi:hypothetical protein